MIKDSLYWADQIKSKKISPEELVTLSLDKIKADPSKLNAVTHLFEKRALNKAKEMTDLSAPFAGVPILIKEGGQNLQGEVASSASKLLAQHKAKESSYFTMALEKAGFIIIGQTNLPEFALKFVSDSKLYGSVKNPVMSAYHAGGSSGGAAAAVQAGMVPLAGASDGGGSIRIPASFSGLVGLKPSRGRIITGPGSYRNWGGAAIDFAITRTIRESWELLKLLQVENFDPMPFQLPAINSNALVRINPKDLRIAYWSPSIHSPKVSDQAIQAVEELVRFLKDQGFRVTKAQPTFDREKILRGYYRMNGGELAKTMMAMEEKMGQPIQRGEIEDTSWLMKAYGSRIKASTYSKVFDDWDHLSRLFYDFHREYDIFIQPTTAYPAPPLSENLFHLEALAAIEDFDSLSDEDIEDLVLSTFESGSRHSPFAYLYNLTGQPAISLPLHTTEEGLPMGVMLSARKSREDIILALAAYLEEKHTFHYYKQEKE